MIHSKFQTFKRKINSCIEPLHYTSVCASIGEPMVLGESLLSSRCTLEMKGSPSTRDGYEPETKYMEPIKKINESIVLHIYMY